MVSATLFSITRMKKAEITDKQVIIPAPSKKCQNFLYYFFMGKNHKLSIEIGIKDTYDLVFCFRIPDFQYPYENNSTSTRNSNVKMRVAIFSF